MILGHERQLQYLQKVFERGRLAHAYLFYGPEQVGKRTVAKLVTKSLFCQKFQVASDRMSVGTFDNVCGSSPTNFRDSVQDAQYRPGITVQNISSLANPVTLKLVGDKCSDCKAIEENRHPYVVVLDTEHTLLSKKVPRPEGRDGGTIGLAKERKEIPIDDIRELKRLFTLTPAGNNWRVAIINEADKLNRNAADAFLKLLEEPGERTLFLLIAEDRESLFPTVISRTLPLGFNPVSDIILKEFLAGRGVEKAAAEDYLAYAAGRPGMLLRFLEDTAYFERMKRLSRAVAEGIRGTVPDALRLAERLADEEELRRQGVAFAIQSARAELLKNFAGEKIAHYKNVHRVAQLLYANVNTRLALDVLFLELRLCFGK